MKHEEAKFVLHAYRANGADADDPTFSAALAQTQQDPVLGRWFAQQQAFDRAVAAQLGRITPPADLRASILAGAKASRPAEGAARGWWRSPWPLAMAAGVAVLFAVGVAVWPRSAAADELASFALEDLRQRQHEAPHGDEAAQFQTMLGDVDQGLRGKLKVDFAALRAGGCHTLQFRGHDVLEVCFKRDGRWFHCYVARVADFPLLATKLQPAFLERGDVSAAAWSDGANIYVVAGRAGREALQRLI